jgi:hypothetical protein
MDIYNQQWYVSCMQIGPDRGGGSKMSKQGRKEHNEEEVAMMKSEAIQVTSIESDKGTVRKVRQYTEYYSVITSGIQGVRGLQPHLLFYDRSATLDKAFAKGDIKVFAVLVSNTIGNMK